MRQVDLRILAPPDRAVFGGCKVGCNYGPKLGKPRFAEETTAISKQDSSSRREPFYFSQKMRQMAVPPLGSRPAGEEHPEVTSLPDEDVPPRRTGYVSWLMFVIIMAVVVVVATFAVFAWVVPRQYPQHIVVSLDAGNGWRSTVCIPTGNTYWGGPGSILVSFSWRSSDNSPVDVDMSLQNVYPPSAAYNVTAPSGSGSYDASGGGSNVYLVFAATGTPTLPTFVNVTVSYNMPGHVLGGPTAPATC